MKIFEKSNSQAGQESFVLNVLKEKKNGWYVEIGSGYPIVNNNTYLLETEYGWNGVGIDWDSNCVIEYNNMRKNKCIQTDATQFNYLKYFEENNFPKQIDYLQVDVEPAQQTLLALKRLPLDQYRFSVITYEHDLYADTANEEIKEESKSILSSLGYKLIAENVDDGTPSRMFEDWWIDVNMIGDVLI